MNQERDPFGTGADVIFPSDAGDWRKDVKDDDPDDEEIETPADVKAILGFDPRELDNAR
jgi:hypothetical protein